MWPPRAAKTGVASAIFERTEPKFDESAILAVRKTADGVTVRPALATAPRLIAAS